MRRFLLFAGCMFTLFVLVRSANAAETKYVEIEKPFANIYEYLDPRSNIIKQATKGEYFELIYEGTSWYQVKIKDKVGWLEKRAGAIVDSPSFFFYSISFGTFALFLILLIGTLAGVSFFIYRQKTAEL